jgi:hypothetical protein
MYFMESKLITNVHSLQPHKPTSQPPFHCRANFNIILHTVQVFQMDSFPPVSQPKPCMKISFLPCILKTQPSHPP